MVQGDSEEVQNTSSPEAPKEQLPSDEERYDPVKKNGDGYFVETFSVRQPDGNWLDGCLEPTKFAHRAHYRSPFSWIYARESLYAIQLDVLYEKVPRAGGTDFVFGDDAIVIKQKKDDYYKCEFYVVGSEDGFLSIESSFSEPHLSLPYNLALASEHCRMRDVCIAMDLPGLPPSTMRPLYVYRVRLTAAFKRTEPLHENR